MGRHGVKIQKAEEKQTECKSKDWVCGSEGVIFARKSLRSQGEDSEGRVKGQGCARAVYHKEVNRHAEDRLNVCHLR